MLSSTCSHSGCQYWLKLSRTQPGHSALLPGHRSAAPWRLPKKSPPIWARTGACARSAIVVLGHRELGRARDMLGRDAERVRERLDREHAGDAPLGVDHRAVLAVGRQQVREGVAEDVVELDDRLGGGAEIGTYALALHAAL